MTDRATDRRDPALLLVGTDHQASPLDLREQVSYSPEETEDLLIHLLARPEIAEAYLLSTCNRTEIYLQPRDAETAYETAVRRVFTERLPEMAQPGRLYVQRDGDAALHLMAVACGLESMVLGEPEILGQVKQAASLADAVGASGTVLKRLLRSATQAGSRARSETAIGQGAVSLGYTVIEIAHNIFTDLEEVRVLLVGAGETARMVARNMLDQNIRHLAVVNRTPSRAEDLRKDFPEIEVRAFEDRVEEAGRADVVVVATGAPEPVVTREQLDQSMAVRPTRKLLVVDLGVPRNVDPAAAKLENVFLHTLDSLEGLIERNLKRRRVEVPRVEEVIREELEHYRSWYRGLAAEPLVARLQKQAERIRRQELSTAQDRFPAEYHEDLDLLTRALVRKILHHPSTTLRGAGSHQDGLPRLDLVRELFRLDDEED